MRASTSVCVCAACSSASVCRSSCARSSDTNRRVVKFLDKELSQVSAQVPDSLSMRVVSGHLKMLRRTYGSAASEYMHVLRAQPDHPLANLYLGAC